MIVGHFSDTHGSRFWKEQDLSDVDVVCHTGDLLPNMSRGHRSIEIPYQEQWVRENALSLARALKGRPYVFCSGNHDFLDQRLGRMLRDRGIRAHDVWFDGSVRLSPRGLRFGGFPQIPYIRGEWNYESSENTIDIAARVVLDEGVDILLTHTPPLGVLDAFDDDRCGSKALRDAMDRADFPRWHLFGHCHPSGGSHRKVGHHRSYNAATAYHRIRT